MTVEDFIHLQSTDSKSIIESHLKQCSTDVAFKIRDSTICTQIKYLARAAEKLPSYFASRCIIDAITYEQSSSEITAFSKFSDLPPTPRELAIDLTCGLGVDAFALSKQFKRVITLETNELRAEIARHNFSLMGASNIEVINTSAEAFCAHNQQLNADLIYVDPSRITTSNQRVYSLEDSQPNVVELLPLLKQMAPYTVIKLSPMFDISECFTIFSDDALVEVVSVKNECKEVIVKLGFSPKNSIKNTLLRNNISKQYLFDRDSKHLIINKLDIDPRFLHIPDVCFYKTRTVVDYMSTCHSDIAFNFQNYIFTADELMNFDGQSFQIIAKHPYQPKNIRKLLKTSGIKRAVIHHRNFPYPTSKIISDLGINEGGKEHVVLAIYDDVPTFFLVTLCK